MTFAEQFQKNYEAISDKVRGGAPHNHIMIAAVILTLFERFEMWAKQ